MIAITPLIGIIEKFIPDDPTNQYGFLKIMTGERIFFHMDNACKVTADHHRLGFEPLDLEARRSFRLPKPEDPVIFGRGRYYGDFRKDDPTFDRDQAKATPWAYLEDLLKGYNLFGDTLHEWLVRGLL